MKLVRKTKSPDEVALSIMVLRKLYAAHIEAQQNLGKFLEVKKSTLSRDHYLEMLRSAGIPELKSEELAQRQQKRMPENGRSLKITHAIY